MKLDIIYEDDDLLIVNKPSGLLVIPDRFDHTQQSLNKMLERQYEQHIYVVHRLDRGTSGAVCFARNEEAHKYMSALFREHTVEKYYTGLVDGRVIAETGIIDTPIMEHPTKRGKMITDNKGKDSKTGYKVLGHWPLYTLLEYRLYTGRTHQIRVHSQSIGHPLVCDELYGDGKPFYLSTIKKKYNIGKYKEERPLLSRLALHASRLKFAGPGGNEISVEAPLPKDIAACVKQLDKWATQV